MKTLERCHLTLFSCLHCQLWTCSSFINRFINQIQTSNCFLGCSYRISWHHFETRNQSKFLNITRYDLFLKRLLSTEMSHVFTHGISGVLFIIIITFFWKYYRNFSFTSWKSLLTRHHIGKMVQFSSSLHNLKDAIGMRYNVEISFEFWVEFRKLIVIKWFFCRW